MSNVIPNFIEGLSLMRIFSWPKGRENYDDLYLCPEPGQQWRQKSRGQPLMEACYAESIYTSE